MVPVGLQTSDIFDVFLARLRESREVSVYGAIERLVQAAEEVGLDAQTLIRILDQGVTFEELLALIESRMERMKQAA